jgi:hypothetical protein
MDDTDINLREQLTRIDLNQAVIQKTFVEVNELNAEVGKMSAAQPRLNADAVKLAAEPAKLHAEGRPFDRERTTSSLGAAILTSGASPGGLPTSLLWG